MNIPGYDAWKTMAPDDEDENLINLDLVGWAKYPGDWGCNGPPPAHGLTSFGSLVARYGDAITILALAS